MSKRPPKKARLQLAERVEKVLAWCHANFPAPLPYTWAVLPGADMEDMLGLTELSEDGTLLLSFSEDQNLREIAETAIHEWAHVLTYPFLRDWQDPHEDYFFIVFGRLYRRWHDQGGQVAALGR